MRKPTVLLVDYDPASVESTRAPLALAGYDVAVAKNGVAGLEAFRSVDPDLVLTQLMLPKLPGLDLCREIRRTRPDGPPILVYGTAPADKGRAQAVAAGASGYLVAPLDPETLVETCNEYLMGLGAESSQELAPPQDSDEDAPGSSHADEAGHAAAAAEILKRLDAFLPSRTSGTPAAPPALEPDSGAASVAHEALAGPPRTVASADAAPKTPEPLLEPTRTVASVATARELVEERPAPRRTDAAVTAIATTREPRPAAPRTSPARSRSRWAILAPGLVLAGGALAVFLVLRGRAASHPEPEPPPAPIERPSSSGAFAATTEAPVEPAPAVAAAADTGSPSQLPAPQERTPAEIHSDPARAAAGVPSESAPTLHAETAKAVGSTRSAPTTAAPRPWVFASPSGTDAKPGTAVPVAPQEPAVGLPDPLESAATESPAPPPRATTRPGDLIELEQADTPPVPRSRTQPVYPALMRRMRYSGTAVLRILVDETGRVVEAEPEGPPVRPEFVAAATKAVRGWRYDPATKDGVPIKTHVTVQVVFQP